MNTRWTIAFAGGLACLAARADGATVSISPSASTVAQGSSIVFTVSVQPSTYVQQVAVSYQGEAGQDVGAAAPFQATHTFNTAASGLVVTATVTYSNGDSADQATATVNVWGLTISGSTAPVRAYTITYAVQSSPAGYSLSQVTWSYSWSGGSNTTQGSSTWIGKMVVDGTLTVSAMVSGVTVQAAQAIIITPRSWPIPISCAQDNDPDYGDVPTVLATLGDNRDRDSDVRDYVFIPRNGMSDFSPARSLAQVTSGPCTGRWYISSSTLKCQRETVINRYVKPDGPVLGDTNFCGANADCFSTSVGDFIQALKNHEYRGTPDTPKSLGGHQGRIEKSIIDYAHDPKQAIEALTEQSQAELAALVDTAILGAETYVHDFAADETYMETWGPNWGTGPSLGIGQHSCWDDQLLGWTDCVNDPGRF